jgi:hypothetical protein
MFREDDIPICLSRDDIISRIQWFYDHLDRTLSDLKEEHESYEESEHLQTCNSLALVSYQVAELQGAFIDLFEEFLYTE